MGLYEEIKNAREILGIPEKANIELVKQKYKEALKKWHPDKCKEDKEICEEKAKEIIRAGKILLGYCSNYLIDFSKEEVEKYISAEELWLKKFGKDPIWG